MTRLFVIGCLFLVGLALGAGFWIVGGPETARQEEQDRQRIRDLGQIATYLSCEKFGTQLPPDLSKQATKAYCGKTDFPIVKRRLSIAVEDMSYSVLPGNSFRVCVDLLNPSRADALVPRYASHDVEIDTSSATACVTGPGASLENA